MKVQVGDLFACPEACPLQFLRSRTSPKTDLGPPLCACGREMIPAGLVLL